MAALSTSTRTDQPLPPSPKSTRGQTPAVRRLMWDWKELQADPLDHVVAAPLEGNMLEWHVNLIGPAELDKLCPKVEMAESVWHMVIRFSDFYPARPPSVVLCTSIPGHLNVLGARPRDGLFPVCMDMLETGNLKQTSTHQYTGWSSAYTVRSILMQLQALLWHRDMYKRATYKQLGAAVEETRQFRCDSCGHARTTPFPPLPSKKTLPKPEEKEKDAAATRAVMLDMPRHVLDQLGHLRRILRENDVALRQPKPVAKLDVAWSAVAKQATTTPAVQQHQLVAQAKKRVEEEEEAKATAKSSGPGKSTRSAPDSSDAGALGRLPTELLLHVLGDSALAMTDIFRVAGTCRYLHWACQAADVWRGLVRKQSGLAGLARDWRYLYMAEHNQAVRDLRCWYTRVSFTDDVLGLPVEITVNPRTKQVDYAMPTMAFLSRTAFYSLHVRVTPGDKRTFTHWLPLYLSETHFDRALADVQRFVAALAQPGTAGPVFDPSMINAVFPKLLNTCAVLLADRGLHASDTAVELYTQLHRVWVACLHRYPAQQANVEHRLSRFMSGEVHRTKTAVPSLGDLLALLSVSEQYGWAQLAQPLLEEVMHRSVLWIGKSNPALIKRWQDEDRVVQVPDRELLAAAFEASAVSRRLIAFHVLFLDEHRGRQRPADAALALPPPRSVAEMALTADVLYGKLPTRVTARIQTGIRAILNETPHWGAWFQRLRVSVLSQLATTRWIYGAVAASLRKGYHTRHTVFSKIQSRGVSKILLRGESYSVAPTARKIAVEETWSSATGLFLDASVLLLDGEGSTREHVTYCHRRSQNGSVEHSGDTFVRDRSEGVHKMTIDLDKVPKTVMHLAFFMSAWLGATLKDIDAPYIRLTDGAQELCTYTFSESAVGEHKSVLMAVLSRQPGKGGARTRWVMHATGVHGSGDVSSDRPMRETARQYVTSGQK
ncbi:hypothetical protein AMAG_19444 [Allomyces macrogynus ATCC 38327]|uniref:UBC core domain-containing protein n=1 Tax=Allomyces macrogynus (strain ATCC 38327) TaxID=578462 RepID=A0A0L0SRN8_ALLM3|nr:hypothetical protein AMAG_19443 [Allomyces macrogynus ATCC 38327]KNE65228.1 hypothetical protein AMAG_19444 [Allomyces macrogynus ATCC 38327]|eukprot:KNE65212.1 hypothetical protein AMAG_19443 [Allomyces macrogynus ATCC 38327]